MRQQSKRQDDQSLSGQNGQNWQVGQLGATAEVLRVLSKDKTAEVGGIKPAACAWWLQQLARASNCHLWVVTDSYGHAQQLRQDLAFFSKAFQRGKQAQEVLLFPHWDTMPFEFFSPSQDAMTERLKALDSIQQEVTTIGVTSVQGWMQATLPQQVMKDSAFTLSVSQQVKREWLLEKLIDAGYTRVELVETSGEFSVRGHLVDIFSPQQEHPLRLDLLGDEIETMRLFNATTQVSMLEVKTQRILPAREVAFNATSVAQALLYLREHKSKLNPEWYQQLCSQLEQGAPFAGCEQLLPLYHGKTAWLHQYLPARSLVVLAEPESVLEAAQAFEAEFMREAERAQQQGLLPVPPAEMFIGSSQLKQSWQAHRIVLLRATEAVQAQKQKQGQVLGVLTANNYSLQEDARAAIKTETPATDKKTIAKMGNGALIQLVQGWQSNGANIVLASRTGVAAKRFERSLNAGGLLVDVHKADQKMVLSIWQDPFKPTPQNKVPQDKVPQDKVQQDKVQPVLLLNKAPSQGFRLLDSAGNTLFALITEAEWQGETQPIRERPQASGRHLATSVAELQAGHLVVHVDYGIGCYRGLKLLTIDGTEGEFLELDYAAGGKVYVPVARLHLVQKYVGIAGGAPRLNKLGDGSWQRTYSRTKKVVQDMARQLVDTQAARKSLVGPIFSPAQSLLDEFAQGFKFQETPDQVQTITEIMKDLAQPQPMDRLVCGEVGFGKTEVAMRAAFAVAIENGQVMILCPTTVLAQQHHNNFYQRFHPLGLRVEMLSRFILPQQQKKTLKEFQQGDVEILIGTHRLLSKDVPLPSSLGLLVIDEEQRFGVAHKERIRRLKTQVNVLTLSATPIPRTLHMAIMGIRDLSLINTPPPDRLAVRTRIARTSDHIIRECIERELRRDGQIFFVHNRVESIYAKAKYIKTLLPNICMEVAHGQMPEERLEKLMQNFVDGKIQVLLCTTIIESGLDIPRANTIIISRAENFGLAQLHQLRGRVGRSYQQGYAWLLTHETAPLLANARKRLNLLQEFSALGAGFRIATHDLEIRGAGNLLGAEQSGHMHKVGLELFTEMVKGTVADMKGEAINVHCSLELPFSYLLPNTYILGARQRLEIYKRLAETSQSEELWQLRQEMEDRFGMPPDDTDNLFAMVQVRLLAESYGITCLKTDNQTLKVRFGQPERIDMKTLMALLEEDDNQLQLKPDNWLMMGPLPASPIVLLDKLEIIASFIYPQAA